MKIKNQQSEFINRQSGRLGRWRRFLGIVLYPANAGDKVADMSKLRNLALLLTLSLSTSLLGRTWTDKDGRSMEAEIVGADELQVTINKGGKEFKVFLGNPPYKAEYAPPVAASLKKNGMTNVRAEVHQGKNSLDYGQFAVALKWFAGQG